MNKVSKYFLLLFALSVTLTILLPNTAHANPAMITYDVRPTANVITGGLSVSSPGDAYDGNLGTSADFRYDPGTAGTFEVKTFSTPASNPIAFVDFKMNYYADAGDPKVPEQYRIVYYVNTAGPVVLKDWSGSAHSITTDIWLNQREPNDGVWDWTDISDIRFIVETGTGGGKSADFEEYEAWVTVTTYRKSTMWLNPASLTDPSSPFTINIDISTVDDLYGWEFKLYYDKTILTISTVTLGPLLNNTAGTPNTWGIIKDQTDNYNATHGRVWVAQTVLGDRPGATTDSGTLATLTFTVDGVGGTTTLKLVDTKLIGYESSIKKLIYMIHDATDGSVTISGVPEFPMGIALEIALAVVIIYAWRRTKRKEPEKYFGNTSLRQRTNQMKYPLQ